MTNARFASLHGLPVALLPFDDARSTPQIRALVTSGHPQYAAIAAGFRLRLGGGRYASAAFRYPLLSALRSTFPARRPQTEAVVKVTWSLEAPSDTLTHMTPESKKALGRVIKAHRERLSWTQERLAGAADVNLRTVQRAESGQGISKDGLGAIAAAFNLDEKDLVKQANNSGTAPPEKRFALRKLKSRRELVDILTQATSKGRSLEIGLPEEHEFNEFIGEDILALSEQIENSKSDKHSLAENCRCAQHIIAVSAKMGFGLFAGNYIEELKSKEGSRKNMTVQIIAAPNTDSRIRKTANGVVLDLVRDTRRLLHGRFLAGHTAYDWMQHQLLAKSDGEERVRDTLRRILAETSREMRTRDEGKGGNKK